MTAGHDVEVLQRVLAAEHAVVYAYGVAGAHLTGPPRARATRGWASHRAARDGLTALLVDRNATPVAPAPAYALPTPVTSPAAALDLLLLVEVRLAATYADAVADLDGDLRTTTARGLTTAALAGAHWRGGSVAFPGLPERAG